MTMPSKRKLDDIPYQLEAESCWYITKKPDRPYQSGGVEGKYRHTPLELANNFLALGHDLNCESIEFACKYTDVVLNWEWRTGRWWWDYWQDNGYSPSQHIVGEWTQPREGEQADG